MANNGYDREMAISAHQQNLADMVAFRRPFISNPDLVARLKLIADSLYGGGPKGYIAYPFLGD